MESCCLFASACTTRFQPPVANANSIVFLTAVAMTHTPTAAELEFEGLKSVNKELRSLLVPLRVSRFSLWLESMTSKPHMRPEEHERGAP